MSHKKIINVKERTMKQKIWDIQKAKSKVTDIKSSLSIVTQKKWIIQSIVKAKTVRLK